MEPYGLSRMVNNGNWRVSLNTQLDPKESRQAERGKTFGKIVAAAIVLALIVGLIMVI